MCPRAQTLPHVEDVCLAAIREHILPRLFISMGATTWPAISYSWDRCWMRKTHTFAWPRFRCAAKVPGRAGGSAAGHWRRWRQRSAGIVLVGRPYNIHDRTLNLDVPGKLRDYYGINVIPFDCLSLGDVDIRDVNDNMYWHSGRRILAAAKVAGATPNLHLIHITNFKCGPDSYIKHFLGTACNSRS
jgi:hypothetical protein